jgi:nucleotide-binding universal stress UspA family protein
VCGTAGKRTLERLVLGSTASSLLHNAQHPLLVVPPVNAPLDRPWLVGYDGSEGAREALDWMAGHLRDRSVVVAHAWRSPVRHTLCGQAMARSKVDTFTDYVDTVDTIWAEVAQQTAEDGAEYARSRGISARVANRESGHGDRRTLLAAAREFTAAAILVGAARSRRRCTAPSPPACARSGAAHTRPTPALKPRRRRDRGASTSPAPLCHGVGVTAPRDGLYSFAGGGSARVRTAARVSG